MIRSVNGTPRLKRKRLRSVTPSDGGHANGNDEYLRSPLAKRKKLAADRSGFSRLKEGITADELAETASNGSTRGSPKLPMEEPVDEVYEDGGDEEDEEEEEDGEGEEEEEEDDFLARDLQDWG